jgi:hypothetical protein
MHALEMVGCLLAVDQRHAGAMPSPANARGSLAHELRSALLVVVKAAAGELGSMGETI